jgi:crotonobetainyl-CoA:carnitine CoA-transferase CaiB-like acyl-CoA transferase
VFAASDGEHVQVVALNQRQWEALCDALGHREWVDDPRCADNDARLANRGLVNDRIRAVIGTRPAGEWVERIARAGGLCERVRGIEEAWADPLLAERGLVGRAPDGAALPLVALARAAGADALAPAPALGEHTEAVVRELARSAGPPPVA